MRDCSSSGRKKTLEAVTPPPELIILLEKSKHTLSPNYLFIVLTNHLKTGVCVCVGGASLIILLAEQRRLQRNNQTELSPPLVRLCVHFWLRHMLTGSTEDKSLHFYEPFPLQQQTAIKRGLIWLLLLLLTANVLLFVHLWHLSPQRPCCKRPC